MSNEYMQHSQCQTCFVDYSINHELMQNIDTYRSEERLLVARLERCRLLLACIGYADDRIRDSEDDNPEPIARLQCPDLLCKRLEQYTTRSNLMFGVMKCAPSVRKYLHELIDLSGITVKTGRTSRRKHMFSAGLYIRMRELRRS
ncbi:uncharacterized protein RSE6_10002 [Rhynchosporium secalis]|uniref:Uncharacterized protein n=1 Tax=Rhynchosporium secalis TaxID=38038 RepID=A0A1E1MJD5_RHYSE|nr:uncharacterized protein RSE6_10002 [Rhynchosporium secalis]